MKLSTIGGDRRSLPKRRSDLLITDQRLLFFAVTFRSLSQGLPALVSCLPTPLLGLLPERLFSLRPVFARYIRHYQINPIGIYSEVVGHAFG
jgi:hypothetical protein